MKIYFPALDSLRAMAMLLVLTGHFFDLYGHWQFGKMAANGLTLFFILSGFLITYLLLLETEASGTVRVRRFYLRRMLRIWPLYYVVVGLAQWLIPYTGILGQPEMDGYIREHSWAMAQWYLLFLPNLPFTLGWPLNGYLIQLWSIGIEEQFYLVWPWVIRISRKHLSMVLSCLILLGLVVILAYFFMFPSYKDRNAFFHLLSKVNAYLYWSNIGYFTLGGAMAFLRLKHPGMAAKLGNRIIQWVALVLAILLIARTSLAGELILGLSFSLLILHATQNGSLVSRLRPPWLLYLGKISYSMYVFHVMVLLGAGRLVAAIRGRRWPPLATDLLGYTLVLGLTIAIGALSYRFVESYFLRIRKNIDPFRSGPEV